jgi:hypothetical protein
MKCQVCKINESKPNCIVCSDRCNKIRLEINRLVDKYKHTNGCENCLGDLDQGCTEICKNEFKEAHEFVNELYSLIRIF